MKKAILILLLALALLLLVVRAEARGDMPDNPEEKAGSLPLPAGDPPAAGVQIEWIDDLPVTFLCDLYGGDVRIRADDSSLWTVVNDMGSRQLRMLADPSGIEWFDEHMSGGMSAVRVEQAASDEHRYYLFGSPLSDVTLFYCTDVGFGGLLFTDKGPLWLEGDEISLGSAALQDEYLPVLDGLTDSFKKAIESGVTRYSAYCDGFFDYYKSCDGEAKIKLSELRQWLRVQCTANRSAEELYIKVRNDTARDADYLAYAADCCLDGGAGHSILELILLRSFCGVQLEAAQQIPLDPATSDADFELISVLDENPHHGYERLLDEQETVFAFAPAEDSVETRLLLLRWESDESYARYYTIELLDGEQVVDLYEVRNESAARQCVLLNHKKAVTYDRIRLVIHKYSGDSRAALREISAWGLTPYQVERERTLLSTEEVAEICHYVHGLIAYGSGPPIYGRSPTEQEILDYGDGHCGEFAFLFIKELSRHGTTAARAYGLASRYYGVKPANHTIVEVETTEGFRVFDPTFDGYYLTDIRTLVDAEDIGEYAVGFEETTVYYATNRFFKEVTSISVIPDIRNSYDPEISRKYGTCTTGMRSRDSNVTYTPTLDDRTIEASFFQAQSFYRIECTFEEPVPASLIASVMVVTSDGRTVFCPARTSGDSSYAVEIQLYEPIEAKLIRIQFRTGAELPRLYIFSIYQ